MHGGNPNLARVRVRARVRFRARARARARVRVRVRVRPRVRVRRVLGSRRCATIPRRRRAVLPALLRVVELLPG